MKYISEFQSRKIIQRLNQSIHDCVGSKSITIMEVCGTHTMAIAKYGLRSLLPKSLRLISGPGCPVCVTSTSYIDHAIALSRLSEVIITTFGDMIRVPGSESSLEIERGKGARIQIVTSTLEALKIAQENPDYQIVFLGVGFETTIPTIGISILIAEKQQVGNYSVLCGHKTMPAALDTLCQGDIHVNGFLCPGHVSAITGLEFYQDIVKKYNVGCVVTGFEPVDILQGILMLCQQMYHQPQVENQYRRTVKSEGNPEAKRIINQVFEPSDADWRGMGWIPKSGLKIRSCYINHDANNKFDVQFKPSHEPDGCCCGDVLTGRMSPQDCSLFGTLCTTDSPVGACMVSSEGSCAAAYRYRNIYY